MISLAFKIDRHTPAFDAALGRMRNRRPMMAAAGKRLEKELRAHFLRNEARPNKNRWNKTHFWSRRIRNNTALVEVTSARAVVEIAAPEFRQKLYGGTIVPKEKKWLALPMRQEAYGRSPALFANLRFQLVRSDLALLVQVKLATPKARGEKRLGSAKDESLAFYMLVKRVTQSPDPHALPPAGALERAVLAEVESFLRHHEAGVSA